MVASRRHCASDNDKYNDLTDFGTPSFIFVESCSDKSREATGFTDQDVRALYVQAETANRQSQTH